jgi:GSH-dependent disulfide-bond oxidoreductase
VTPYTDGVINIPRTKFMIDLYTWKTPNGRKISVMLEETGLPYTVKPVDISAGEQHTQAFLSLSPNGRIPAIVDHDAPTGPLSIFESGAILTYLAEKTGKFLAPSGPARYDTLAWLSWQLAGLAPMFGQLVYFSRQKERNEGAIARYAAESGRLLRVLNTRLAQTPYLAGQEYSIADIATYPWVSVFLNMMKEALPEDVREMEATAAWLQKIAARPAVQRGMVVPG